MFIHPSALHAQSLPNELFFTFSLKYDPQPHSSCVEFRYSFTFQFLFNMLLFQLLPKEVANCRNNTKETIHLFWGGGGDY